MRALAVIVGVVLVLTVGADLVNTLVTTRTSRSQWWLTRQIYFRCWRLLRKVCRFVKSDHLREMILSTFAAVSLLLLLVAWVAQQIVGFGLIWWGLGQSVDGVDGLGDAIYYSGVVFFTVGFGEVVPIGAVARVGALIEALFGVLTVALVIGYLPALYGAFNSREKKLMTLDDGSEDRITPTSLVIAHAPNGEADELVAFFAGWEEWVSDVFETHTTFPMLMIFRSKHKGQHWVTALGLITDAALHGQIVNGASGKAPYWLIRRSILLLQHLTEGVDLTEYYAAYDANVENTEQFRVLHTAMETHGFDVLPYDESLTATADLHRAYAPQLEYLIDLLMAPRGFWSHAIGIPRPSLVPSIARPADRLPE